MIFTVKKHEIRDVLAKIQGLTGRKSNISITESVLIKAEDSAITMTATDLETGFQGRYSAVVEESGAVAINSKKFFEIVRDFPVDEIHIQETEKHWVRIGNQNVEYQIVGVNPDDFPETPNIEEAEFLEVESAAFKKMIERTIFISSAPDDRRPHISGVFFERFALDQGKSIRMVSTDGSRLAMMDYHLNNDATLSESPGILIPKKGLAEVIKFLGVSDTVKIGVYDNRFIVKKESETIHIMLMEGDFPKYTAIIKKGDGKTARVNRQLFQMMLKRMSILSTPNYKGVFFSFNDNRLTVSAANPELGESKEDMLVEFTHDKIELVFNPKFFIDALNLIEDEYVLLHLIDERRPCLMEGESDPAYLNVIMPMKL